MTAERRKRPPTHPGAILREDVLPALGLSKTETARRLGVSRQTLYDILREKRPVTPAMALRLGKFCGNGPRLWLNMQVAHDLWHESRRVDLSKVSAHKGRLGRGRRTNGLEKTRARGHNPPLTRGTSMARTCSTRS